jgi:hypothetical protein
MIAAKKLKPALRNEVKTVSDAKTAWVRVVAPAQTRLTETHHPSRNAP